MPEPAHWIDPAGGKRKNGKTKAPTDEEYKKFNQNAGFNFPDELKKLYHNFNGFSGMIGKTYITIFNINDIVSFNQKYQTEKYYKNYIIFASNGGGESFGFIKNKDFEILKVTFVQMNEKYTVKIANTADDFVNSFKTIFSKKIEEREEYEIIEIQPIILGGSPTSKENKTAIKREQHFEYVTFWNNKIDEIIKETGNPTTAST